ncbi:hypothetical protein ADIARSV_0434 [Arcticibacter svalbardensis MN12-7]|uniref:DUF2383 domain-containing protein n=1 Tax=Arcticibacter svalbardensis MN12-7 TaxID=1150600 RepID=R9GX46_9SPHI|nr:PA2169 family four-helix-bundle protein [Arcticibacter svalbardensis]EOR96392.1 hypothetical protein ADIARSV_0434 [Arcticibacter svalbardensis MN12-7]
MSYSENYNKQLHRLYKILQASHKGYLEAKNHTESSELKDLFEKYAIDRELLTQQMRDKIAHYGGNADLDHDDAVGLLHRGWLSLKTSLTANTAQNILESCRNADQVALDAYDDALQGEILNDFELKTFLMEQRLNINENYTELDRRYFSLFKKNPSL